MPDLIESDEAFDLALLSLLEGVALNARADLVNWSVKADLGDAWEIDVWVGVDYLGRYLARVGEYELLCG